MQGKGRDVPSPRIPSADPYGNLRLASMDRLLDVSVQAERVYCRLSAGRFSTRTGLLGYREPQLAAESRLRPSELNRSLQELVDAGLLLWCRSHAACYLVGYCSRFARSSVSNWSAWRDDVLSFRCIDLAPQVLDELEHVKASGTPEGTQSLGTGTPKGPAQGQGQGQGQVQTPTESSSFAPVGAPPASQATEGFGLEPKTATTGTRFRKPTIDEAVDYFIERGGDVTQAERFLDFYESKGWLVGKSPMKDWRSAVRNWMRDKKAAPPAEPPETQPMRAGCCKDAPHYGNLCGKWSY